MDPTRLPIACELFAQWRRLRGDRNDPPVRPFSMDWEKLLEAAQLLSGTERSDADREARRLADEGWVVLKAVRARDHLIRRITIPLARESRWREAFGFVPPTDQEAREIEAFAWQPELAFVPAARLSLSFAELRRVDDFLRRDGRQRPLAPIKERSIQIFDDEKRLDTLYQSSALFGVDRLTLGHLRCYVVPEPLGWRRGPGEAKGQPVLVIENAATWDTYCRFNAAQALFSAVVYGGGNRFRDGVVFLAEIFRELEGPRQVLYFGDLDVAGLRIPQQASARALDHGLPTVEPHLPSYRWLLEAAGHRATPHASAEVVRREDCAWLGELAEAAWQILSHGNRLAQERVGWELLSQSNGNRFKQ